MQKKPADKILNGWRITSDWGCITFENEESDQPHGAAVRAIREKMIRTHVTQKARVFWCGRSISSPWIALTAEASARYRKRLEMQVGKDEARYFVPNHDNFRVYLCSS